MSSNTGNETGTGTRTGTEPEPQAGTINGATGALTTKEKLWSKDLVFSMIANMSASFIFYLLMTTMALYAFYYYDVSASVAGMTSSIYIVGSMFGRIITGRYIELIGRRKLVLIASLLQLIFGLTYLLPFGLVFLFIMRFLHGAVFGIVNTSIFTIAASYIPESRKGEGIGYYGLGATVTTAIGPFIAVTLAENHQFTLLFIICSGFAAITLIFLLLMKIDSLSLTAAQRSSVLRGFSLSDFLEPKAFSIAAIGIIVSACYAGVTAYLSPYAEQMGLLRYVTGFFLAYALLILFTRPMAGKLLDTRGDNIVMVPALIFFSLSMMMLGLTRTPFLLILSGAVMALGFGVAIINGNTISVRRVPPHRVAMASATFYVFADIGMGVAPMFFGQIVDGLGYPAMYFTEAAILAASVGLYFIVHGRFQKKR
jgi:MFS family permease